MGLKNNLIFQSAFIVLRDDFDHVMSSGLAIENGASSINQPQNFTKRINTIKVKTKNLFKLIYLNMFLEINIC